MRAHLVSLAGMTTASMAFLALACTPGEKPSTKERMPETAQSNPTTLTILAPAFDDILSPYWSSGFDHMVFLSLFDFDENGEVRGRLARAWEMQEDGRTWVYHLHTDVRWHDGVPFTAQDVKFTYDLLTDPDVLYWSPDAQTVRVVDDSTVAITFLDADAWPEPFEWWAVYYPKHLLKDLDPSGIREWEFWKAPVGNGPYRFERASSRTFIELTANQDYFRGPPSIDRVVLKLGSTDPTAAMLDLMAGNADVAVTAFGTGALSPEAGWNTASQDPLFEFYWEPGDGFTWIHWNHEHPILGDRRVREALTLALDPQALAAVSGHPPGVPLFARVRFGPGVPPADLYPVSQDFPRARQLLEEAGWMDEDGDGVRERGGEPLRLEALGSEELLVILQAQFQEVGARLEIVPVDNRVRRERIASGDFDFFLGSAQMSVPGARDMMGYLAHPDLYKSRHSLWTLQSPALFEQAARFETAVAPEVRAALFSEIWDLWLHEIPATPLVASVSGTVARSRVHGLSSPYRTLPGTYIDELWIDEDWDAEGTGLDPDSTRAGGEG